MAKTEQREIKFRAWDKPNKKMVNQAYIDCNRSGFRLLKNDEFIFMQYTGLKDKNGKDIYDGDIVRLDETWLDKLNGEIDEQNVGIFEVIFTNFVWRLWGKIKLGDGCNRKSLDFTGYSNYSWGKGWEDWNDVFRYKTRYSNLAVIGNIYENPELIRSK